MALTTVIVDSPLRSNVMGTRYIEVIATETAPGTTKTTTAEIDLGKAFAAVEPIGQPSVIPVTDTNFVSAGVTKEALLGSTYTTRSVIKLTYTSGVNESIIMRQLLRVKE